MFRVLGMVIWNRDPVVRRLDGLGTAGLRRGRRKRREGSSCHQEDFVANKVKPNSPSVGAIKKERSSRLQHVLAQLVPRVPFRVRRSNRPRPPGPLQIPVQA